MGKKKPIALVFVKHFKPGYRAGGPTRSIINIVDCLKNRIDFRIVCLSYDHNSVEKYKNIKANKWNAKYGIKILYLNRKVMNILLDFV